MYTNRQYQLFQNEPIAWWFVAVLHPLHVSGWDLG